MGTEHGPVNIDLMTNDDDKQDNWRQFNGTELGGLMNKIYGNEGRPKINYPKPKARKSAEVKEPYRPCGGKADAKDHRNAPKKDVKVAVPKLGRRSGSGYAAIDCVPRRKQEDNIRVEIDEIAMRRAHYRPAYTKAISTDAEKDKYNQICAYHGGKGLPQEMTAPEGEAPFELTARKKEAERMQKLRSKYRRGGPEDPPRIPAPLSHKETMATLLSEEINERVDHLKEMTELGASARETAAIRSEISTRVAELKRIDGG